MGNRSGGGVGQVVWVETVSSVRVSVMVRVRVRVSVSVRVRVSTSVSFNSDFTN